MITILNKESTIKDTKMKTTIKATKNQLYRLIDELNKYDEKMECCLCLDDNHGGDYLNQGGFANFLIEPIFDRNTNELIRVDIANF